MDSKAPLVRAIESCVKLLASILGDLIDAGDVVLDDFAEHLRSCIKALLEITEDPDKGGEQ